MARATETTILPVADSIVVLMDEYKLHRQDYFNNHAAYNRQSNLMQLYGAFLFGFVGLLYTSGPAQSALNDVPFREFFGAAGLLIGASLAFYFVASAMHASFNFQVLRLRMAVIEDMINTLSGRQLLRYESKVTPKLYGWPMYSTRRLAPHAWSASWRTLIFLSVIYILCLLSFDIVGNNIFAISYSISVVFFAVITIREYISINTKGNIEILGLYIVDENINIDPPRWPHASKLVASYISAYVLFLGLGVSAPGSLTLLAEWLASYSSWPIEFLVFGYSVLAATVLPLPSEAPLAVMTPGNWVAIAFIAALGKMLGSLAVVVVSVQSKRLPKVREKLDAITKSIEKSRLWDSKGAGLAYLLMQAIPFMPMRTATIAYALTSITSFYSYLWIAMSTFVGSITRTFLVWVLVQVGLMALPQMGLVGL